jgi:hypothetical protein
MNAIPRRYVLAGRAAVRRTLDVLRSNGLEPAFSEWLMTNNGGRVWLLGVLDVRRIAGTQRRYTRWYTDPDLLHDLSTACNGVPVYTSNSNGLRYAFLLSRRPRLPRRADFPGCERGLLRLGIGPTGCPVAVRWDDLGHLLVAGMTGSGKSTFLRLLVHQGLHEGASLLLGDLSGTTFPMLRSSSALLAPIAVTPGGEHAAVSKALAECDRRRALYGQVEGYPEKLVEYNASVTKRGGEPLPRVLVVLDEFNSAILELGGARGKFAGDVASLCWQGRKFGVHVVVAAQDFDKRVVGRMRDQTGKVCFRIESPELARAIGCAGAHRIPQNRPGQAVTGRWGLMQSYCLDKAHLIGGDPVPVLDGPERALVAWALEENEGYVGIGELQGRLDLSEWQARTKAKEWEMRGWLVKDADAGNKRRITTDFRRVFSHEPQTSRSPSIRDVDHQTGPQADSKPSNCPAGAMPRSER